MSPSFVSYVIRVVLLTLSWSSALAAPVAIAQESTPCDHKKSLTACVTDSGGGFGVGMSQEDTFGQEEVVEAATVNRTAPTRITQTSYVPTCTGNSGVSEGNLCSTAADSCPVEGEVRFWVFTREYDLVAKAPVTGWKRVAEPSTVCLGPEDPVVDPAVAIPALMEREFRRVVVVKGVAEVSPRPHTLVNIATVFTTSTPGSYDIPLTLLGRSVVITATAQRWTWHFGDGASASTTARGSQGRVEYEYRRTGDRQAYVVIDWSGSYRLDGGASRPITGTATTTGESVQVQVRQARAELVRE